VIPQLYKLGAHESTVNALERSLERRKVISQKWELGVQEPTVGVFGAHEPPWKGTSILERISNLAKSGRERVCAEIDYRQLCIIALHI
jgi:hypothetical protein